MEEIYISLEDLIYLFEKGKLKQENDIIIGSKIGFFCVTELIYVIELVKKQKVKIIQDIDVIVKYLKKLPLNPLCITQDSIKETLFTENEDGSFLIDVDNFQRYKDIRLSSAVTCAKIHESAWWSEDIYLQIIEHFHEHKT